MRRDFTDFAEFTAAVAEAVKGGQVVCIHANVDGTHTMEVREQEEAARDGDQGLRLPG